jgi:KaiC/GvpD/RAD55 family RecA-like ATPase
MNEEIKRKISIGELILFLGAGASKGCKSSAGNDLLDGQSLAKELANRASMSYSDEELEDVYGAVRNEIGSRLDPLLEELFRHVTPSEEYVALSTFSWRRIYTLNIDDGLERAFSSSAQRICQRLSSDPIEDRDPFFQRLDIVKLNGSIDKLHNGIIFSAPDYAKATSRGLPWYEQCGSDFVRAPFLFIGTKIKEPLLKFHIERYKTVNQRTPGKSYVITPSATEIEKQSLKQYNIEHISGTLGDFVRWLQQEFCDPPTPRDLAVASLPPYAAALSATNKEAYYRLFEGVSLVTRDMTSSDGECGAIRDFYKGFKPSWNDIISGIPAELDTLDECSEYLEKNLHKRSLISLIGPAGSGKSTLLMQLAHRASGWKKTIVYYFEEPLLDVTKTLLEFENSSNNFDHIVVAIDNLDRVAEPLIEALKSGKLTKTTIICAERESVWIRKTKSKIGDLAGKVFNVNEFTERDARKILQKLQEYGSWTILGQIPEKDRISALINRAGKQLLIALLEATYGRGFEKIIESDYKTLENDEQRIFFLTVGVITERNFSAPVELIDRALSANGFAGAGVLSAALSGIIVNREGKLAVRHRVYVRHLLEQVVPPDLTARAIKGLLLAFSHYNAPVIRNVSKVEAAIYKGIINHSFLWEVLKGKESLIVSLYRNLEKSFELDGLFWLQYGLALRDMSNDDEALDKLRTAFNAYPMPHTQHALGQQLLIIGRKTEDRITALAFADEARSLLESLDEVMESDDTYPIVTLAEGHVALMREVSDEAEARSIARSYLPALEKRKKSQPDNLRLQECFSRIFKYSATGTWIEIS